VAFAISDSLRRFAGGAAGPAIFLILARPVTAQSLPSDPSVDNGTHWYGSYDGVHENISLSSGNLSFCIPLVSLKGPNKHDVNIPLCYNSQFQEAYTYGSQFLGAGDVISYFPWQWAPNTPSGDTTPPMGAGWSLLGSPGFYESAATSPSQTPVEYMPDGARYSIVNNPRGPDGQNADVWYDGGLLTTTMKDGSQWTYSSVGSSSCPPAGCVAETFPDSPGVSINWTNHSVTDFVGRTVSESSSSTFSGSNKTSSTAYVAFQYPDSTGTMRTVSVQMATMQFGCQYNGSGGYYFTSSGQQLQATYSMPTAVILPNGLVFTFQYDQCGLLRKVTYPSGGYTRYDYQPTEYNYVFSWGSGGAYVNQIIAKHVCPAASGGLTAALNASGYADTCTVAEETTQYSPTVYLGALGTANSQNIVTDPIGNYVVYQFSAPDGKNSPSLPAVETSRQYYNTSGSLLKTVTTQYTNTTAPGSTYETGGQIAQNQLMTVPALPTIQTTTLDNGMVSQIQWSYNLWGSNSNDSVLTEERVYDFGQGAAGALLKRTDYDWLHRDNPSAYGWPVIVYSGGSWTGGNHICDRKTSEAVYDGSGKMIAQTKYVYDSNNGGGPGLLTSVQKWRSTDGAWLTTSYTYGAFGNVATMTDSNSNLTQYSYADNYTDGVNRDSNAFLTQTIDPLNHVAKSQYYWGSGLVAATCGENFSGTCEQGLTSGADYASYSYDLMGRKVAETTGDGGQTTNCFSEIGGSGCSASGSYPLQVTSTGTVASGVNKVSEVTLDGEARTTRSQLNSDPSCSGGTVNVDTTYDADERKSTVSNPYCSTNTGAPTSGTTTYTYDGLSRVVQVTHPDGTTATNTYTGRAVLSADEGDGTRRVQRISQSDALGRLIYVCEVTGQIQQGSSNNTPSSCGLDVSGTGFLTTYGYDASNSNGPLESLTNVTQGGVARSFIYDSLGELRSAANPESGTTTYGYDNDGNLTSKTDAKSIVTTYSYDHLNRLTAKTYSDGTTPSACFQYDQNSSGRGIGRLTTEWTQTGICPSAPPSSGILTQRTFASYDPMGRVTSDEQCASIGNCTGTSAYALSYTYDLAGDVTQFTNGLTGSSAMTFTSQYSSAGRLSAVNGPVSPGGQSTPLFIASSYTPVGALQNALIGTGSVPGINFHRDYNSRLLPTDEIDGVATTPGTATAQFTGTEQVYAYSAGSFTFSGTEQCSGSTCDSGTFLVTIGSTQSIQVNYGQNSTPSTLASALAGSVSCTNNAVQAVASGGTVYLQSCSAGTNIDYSLSEVPDGHGSSFSQYSFSVSASGAAMTPILSATTGSNAVTFSGTEQSGQTGQYLIFVLPKSGPPVATGSVNWGSSSTPSTMASSLASSIGSCSISGNAVGAVEDGPTTYIIPCQTGTSYTLSIELNYYSSGSGPDFTAAGATTQLTTVAFAGTEQGSQTGGILVFVYEGQNPPDVYTVDWGSGSTPSTLAASLVSSLGSCSSNGNLMEGLASGGTVYLTPCQTSQTYSVSAEITGCSCSQGNGPDFSVTATSAGPSLPGVPGATYDAGTATLSVNGTQIASVSYGSGSTPSTIASALASNGASNSLVTLSASGANLTMTAIGDGTVTDYSYAINVSSTEGSVFSEPSFAGSPNSGALTGGSNAPLYNWAINSYAPDGDVLSMTDSVMGTWSYAYDDFNRLTGGTASAGVDDTLALNWTYDRYGNRWAQNASGSGNISAVQPNLSFNGNNNQVTGWSYDADGNLTNDERNSYSYDAEGRITTLNGAPTYMYDAEGLRVAKLGSGGAVATSYLLGPDGEQVTELNASGGWVHSNAWAGGRLLATYEGAAGPHPNTYHFHLTDWLTTQRMQTNAAGNAEEECYSYPFGDGLTCTGSDATEHHFTSKMRDTESGLDYFGARYLNSNLGRFMTPDWAAKPAAVPYATFGNPQSLNLYGYVRGNPNLSIDADGHVDWGEVMQGVTSFFTALTGKVGAGPGVEAGLSSKAGENYGFSFKGGASVKTEVSASAKGVSWDVKAEAGGQASMGGAYVKAMPSATLSLIKDGKVDMTADTDKKPFDAGVGGLSVNGDKEISVGATFPIPGGAGAIPTVIDVSVSENVSQIARAVGQIAQGLASDSASGSSSSTSTSTPAPQSTPPPSSTANASSPPGQN
jgi:RHS repeat-associated protein